MENKLCADPKCGHEESIHADSVEGQIGFDNLGKCIAVVGKRPIKPVKIWTGKYKRFEKVRCSCKGFVKQAGEHKCSFGFEKKYIGKKGIYEPKEGETGFSIKKDDWVCRCGKTRREYLKKDKCEKCGFLELAHNSNYWKNLLGEKDAPCKRFVSQAGGEE